MAGQCFLMQYKTALPDSLTLNFIKTRFADKYTDIELPTKFPQKPAVSKTQRSSFFDLFFLNAKFVLHVKFNVLQYVNLLVKTLTYYIDNALTRNTK